MTRFVITCFIVLSLIVMVPSRAQELGNYEKMPGGAKGNHTLKENYYMHRCPNAEKIVADHVKGLFDNDPIVVAAFIRLLFHDCFVNVRIK